MAGLFTHNNLKELTEFEQDLYHEWVAAHTYDCFSNKTTTAIVKLRSGFEVVGTSGCEDPAKFDRELGELYAVKDALRKIGEFAAFHRAQVKLEGKKAGAAVMVSTQLSEEIKEAVKEGIIEAMRYMNDPLRRHL